MKHRRSPTDAAEYQRAAKKLTRGMDRVTAEVFVWLGVVGGIGALHGVANQTESPWLAWFCYILSLLLLGRMNWFVYSCLGWTKHREQIQPDGSLVTHFQGWRLILSALLFVPVALFAFGLPLLIARSDLLSRDDKASASAEKIPESPPTRLKPAATLPPEAASTAISTSPAKTARATKPANTEEASGEPPKRPSEVT